MNSLNPNPTPKGEFVSSADNLKAHHALIEQPAFERAIITALAEFTRQAAMSTPGDATPAAAQMFRIQGAHAFVDVLMHLAETPTNIVQVPRGNLNHRI